MSETLIIFSRYPESGKTKTRMIPSLGAEGASELQRQMTEHCLKISKKLLSSRSITIEVHFAGGNKDLMAEWLGQDLEYVPQIAGDLGDKMCSAFDRSFGLGTQRVVIIGIDCPDINQDILENAFDSLQKQDVVIGPAQDGGYYLIGLNQTIPSLFQQINWGTEKVLKQTQNIAQQLNLSIDYLPILSDVDRPEDLGIWLKYRS